ncbi:UPF0547 protein C16orf87 homolog [Diadema antillarum]|uniref:UPF0547 protein C16orf87 homolog n=1 Tax=Diadema antillarum TaxID=105358 RepID=UPI003A83CBF7
MGKVTRIKNIKKMVVKQCPNCENQVPVACKLCRCGHSFFSKRLIQSTADGDEDGTGVKRRRTERVRRERPDYYSASEFENHLRRISTSKSGDKGDDKSKKKKVKRGRPKGSQNKNKDGTSAEQKEKDKEIDMYANIPTDKAFIYAVVLAEINEKIQSQTFKLPASPGEVASTSRKGLPEKA